MLQIRESGTGTIGQNKGKWTTLITMNLLWMETVLLFHAENTQNQEILNIRGDKQLLKTVLTGH